jgi:hypothetical protein
VDPPLGSSAYELMIRCVATCRLGKPLIHWHLPSAIGRMCADLQGITVLREQFTVGHWDRAGKIADGSAQYDEC